MGSQSEAQAEQMIKVPEDENQVKTDETKANADLEIKQLEENFKSKTVQKMVCLAVPERELYMSPKMAQRFIEEGDDTKGQIITFVHGKAFELRLSQARYGGVRVCWDEVNGGTYLNDLWGNIWGARNTIIKFFVIKAGRQDEHW